jgi:hypothetical protein
MTPQEEQMLNDLVQKLNRTSLQEKDDDAERLLRDGLGRNPDAMYMLAQTVLVQNIALEQAHQQVVALQQASQQPQPAKATSFLGSLLGHRDPQPAQYQAPPGQAQYQPVQQYAQPAYGQPQYAQPAYGQPAYQAAPGGQPSFLRSAATTAAGVAAGALAFEGVESLLHPGGMGGFGGGGFGGGFGGEAPREEIVNNYYDSPGGTASGGNDWNNSPNEQPQGPFDGGQNDVADNSYGDDYSDGGGDFGGDDTNFS